MAACRAVLRRSSKTFFAASLLLPRRVREPASALYAFCRFADDAADCGGGEAALADLRERLALVYDGRPLPLPVDRALADVVARFEIPRVLPEALFEGFSWDAAGRRYEDIGELHGYAARVAGTVGAMMAVLMGERSADGVARACDLGVAMQLSNIARDVGEDARAGRLYLPLSWLREVGIDPDGWMARPVFDEALGSVIARLLGSADELYRRADAGIAMLPWACRPGIHAARHLYAEIGREVERQGGNSVDSRAVVAPGRKAALLVRSLAASVAEPRAEAAPGATAETRFLVEAVAGGARQVPESDGRLVWLIGLFDRLERGDRFALSGGVEARK